MCVFVGGARGNIVLEGRGLFSASCPSCPSL